MVAVVKVQIVEVKTVEALVHQAAAEVSHRILLKEHMN
jgi:hypothetical protein